MNPFRFTRLSALLLTGLSATLLSACSDKTTATPATPDVITVNQPALYPESLAYDATGDRFILGSAYAGTVSQVKMDGAYLPLVNEAQLITTTGILVDAPRKRVLVAVCDNGTNSSRTTPATQYQLAALASYDLSTGQRLSYVNLSNLRPGLGHLANDVAVDTQGNCYVTDSFAPIIYKIDTQGTPTVFLQDSRLAAPAGNFGLNGIVFHPDGYLLVAKYDDGTLYKVPLANPAAFTHIAAAAVPSADGLLLADNNTLLAACNGQTNTVFQLRTADGWATATPTGSVATGTVFPTALVRRGQDIYVLHSHIDALLAG